MELAKEAYVAR